MFHGVIFTNSFGFGIDKCIKERIGRVVLKQTGNMELPVPQTLRYSLLNMLGGVLEIQRQDLHSVRLGIVGIYDLSNPRDIRRNAELLRPKHLNKGELQEKMLATLLELYPCLTTFPIYGVVPYEDGINEGVVRVLTREVSQINP